MPVNDEIDLRTISKEELERIDKDYEEIERKAREIEKTKNKIRSDVAEANALGGSPQDIQLGGDPTGGGIFGGEVRAPRTSKQATGKARGDVIRAAGGLAAGQAPITRKEKVVTERNILDILKKKEQIASGGIMQALGGIRDPIGFARSGALQMLTKVALPIGVVITIATTVFEMVKKQFGPGGLFDIRKLVQDQVKEMNHLDYLIKIRAGAVLFTSDAGQDLRQAAPRGSNTRELRDGHVRFQQLHFDE